MKIAVIGLGYVGLPLAIQFARSNVNVIGLDVDKTKVDLITAGKRGSESVSQRLTGAHNYLEEDFFAGQRIRLIWRGRSGPIPRVIYMKNLEARRSQIREFANERCSRIKGWEILDGVYRQVLTRYKLIINK